MSYSIQQADIDRWLSTLQGKVTQILQGSQESENLLGTLEFTKNTNVTIPAIYRRSKDLINNQWRMKVPGGIECIIHDNIDIKTDPMLGGNAIKFGFRIELVQHNPELTTLLAKLRLTNNTYLDVLKSPLTSPYAELPQGIAFERTIIEACVGKRMGLERLIL
ncbi:hypothetical protein [Crocosphaera sp.]|uniref:hypothetical protein n=1 Tax=Crocosphaera sp. TaxID=2729996 RepID=UPI0026335FAC|nr:hypothetical protein [Crocosphaera sp.]MDJ0579078.1 hypothetical protein [Crocosphaera sp.]